jgi:asparagine synthase (glutamine-hydrolysing)
MCGICGVYCPSTPLDGADREIAAMLSVLTHRGPDSQGVHTESNLSMGSRRLAIIDLTGGDQPIYSEDGAICAVYNGEIYNHRELRRQLQDRGHHLASRVDSEVLVHLYEEEGIDFVERLNGMFAFALWDSRRSRLYLARDRLGQKPLYYHWDGTTLCFASEVRSLTESGRVQAQLDPDACLELLTFQNILSARSLFHGVELLPAGSVLELGDRQPELRRYWDPLPDPDPNLEPQAVLAELRERFDSAVERHLLSDVPLASYLSGGLDTGAVTAAATRRLPLLTTFATGFDTAEAQGMEAGFDERQEAAALAGQLGTHHHELRLDSHALPLTLPRLVRHLEEPRMSFSYPNYLTAGMVSRWVKVVLSGVGGDELFGGYPWRYAIAEQPDFIDAYFGYWNRLLDAGTARRALSEKMLAAVDLARPRDVFDQVISPADGLSPLDRILYFESKTFLHGLLVIEDKLSMAHSLEARAPFLDRELVDFVLTVPVEMKLQAGKSKDLFRKAMSVSLPEEVISRGKTGFTPPQGAWFRSSQADYVEEILLSERARDRGIFRVEFVRETIAEHRTGRFDRRLLIWTMLCLEWWHRIFLDREHV